MKNTALRAVFSSQYLLASISVTFLARDLMHDFLNHPKPARQEGAAGQYRHSQRHGWSIGILDTMIAAHALASKAVPVTNNTREFARVPELRLQDWAGSEQAT